MGTGLDKLLSERISSFINLQDYDKYDISKLTEDITICLKFAPISTININYNLEFKDSKREFKRLFLTNLLMKNYGNISEVAKIVDVNRRSIHRIVDDDDIKTIREKLPKRQNLLTNEITSAIDDSGIIETDIFNEHKIDDVYETISKFADKFYNGNEHISLKEAELEFEKKYLKKALTDHNYNIQKTADKIGIRYETLFRKIKNLGLA